MEFLTLNETVGLQRIITRSPQLETSDDRSSFLSLCDLKSRCDLRVDTRPSKFAVNLLVKLSEVYISSEDSEKLGLVHFLDYLLRLDSQLPDQDKSFIESILEKLNRWQISNNGKQAEKHQDWLKAVDISFFHVKRTKIEDECCQTILRSGSLLRIKAPYKMGKTWLMYKVITYVKENGWKGLVLDLQLSDPDDLADFKEFTKWFCETVSEELGIPPRLDTYWTGSSNNYRTTKYFQKYLLNQIEKDLVLALDNVDLVFENSRIAKSFCGLLRSWNQKAQGGDRNFRKLHLIIVHSTEIYSSIDINQSPLAGVGLTVNLQDFSPEEVQDLLQQYQLLWHGEEVADLMNLVGGHPYLIKEALEQISQQRLTLRHLLQIAHTESGPYADHLRRQLLSLEKNSQLLEAIKQLVSTDCPISLNATQRFQLDRMGLVNIRGNKVEIRCNLYKKYFCDCLGVSG